MTTINRDRSAVSFNRIANRAILVISAMIMMSFFTILCGAQTLDYGTYSGYGIAKGILGNDYSSPLPSCITGTHSDIQASQASVNVSIVYTSDEYSRAFHIDQSASATFLGIGGGGEELHFGQEESRSNRAFDIIVEAYGEHNSQTINNIDWDSVHKDRSNSSDPRVREALRMECGDRYIETVFNETRLFAVIHVSSQQTSTLTQFSGKANGSIGLDVVSANAALGGEQNVKSAHQSGALSVNIYSEGLGGIIPTAAAISITSGDGLQDISTKLAAYLSSLKEKDTGQPVKYRLSALPGMSSGSLTDQTIFDDLTEIKGKYAAAYARSENVKSLLGQDPRRVVLIEPEADKSLKQQQSALKTYLVNAAKAHDACRKGASGDVCDRALSQIGNPPKFASVELWPVLAPTLGPFQIAINGHMVSPADIPLILGRTGTTLLDAAKGYQNDPQNLSVHDVDIVAIMVAPYLSHVELPILAPNGTYPPRTVGALTVRARNMPFPSYWKDLTTNAVALHVAHADPSSPCPIQMGEFGISVLDSSCLTIIGKALRDIGLAEAAQASVPPYKMFQQSLGGTTTDCFGTSTVAYLPSVAPNATPSWIPAVPFRFPANMGFVVGEISAPMASQVSTIITGFLDTGTPTSIALFQSRESHDYPGWAQLAGSRAVAVPASGLGSAGMDLCTAHVK